MLDKVKRALRISHSFLDEDIVETIAQARSEMERAGVKSSVARSDSPIVEGAIKTFCLYIFSENLSVAEGYFKSWEYQLDNIRKSSLMEE